MFTGSAQHVYEKWLTEWSDIQGHLPLLRACAKGNVLEIGVRGGVSTSALLAGLEANGGRLLSVDIDDCSQVFRGHPQWAFERLHSVRDRERILSLLPTKLDLIFIDGDHSYEAVLSDLTTYAPLADRMLLHDTEGTEWPGVRRAVEEYVAMSKRPVVWHTGSYGMAEITR